MKTYVQKLKPFLWVAFFWCGLGSFLSFEITSQAALEQDLKIKAVGWFLTFWSLSLLNLFFLARASEAIMDLMVKKKANAMEAILWSFLKITTLGLIAFFLFRARDTSILAIVLGLATMILVPLFGGLWWNQGSHKQATRSTQHA